MAMTAKVQSGATSDNLTLHQIFSLVGSIRIAAPFVRRRLLLQMLLLVMIFLWRRLGLLDGLLWLLLVDHLLLILRRDPGISRHHVAS